MINHAHPHDVGLDCPIRCLRLSLRTYRPLINDWSGPRPMEVGDLFTLDEESLLDIDNIGPGRVAEIRQRLAAAGLDLGSNLVRLYQIDITDSDITYHPPRNNTDDAYIEVARDVRLHISVDPGAREKAGTILATLITVCESLQRDLKGLDAEQHTRPAPR